jgi:SAM-dependent methyltransferase
MPVAPPDSLIDSFAVLADPTRCRMLRLLDRHELTVSELCAVLQLPQSTVSRQLKTLADADWVSSRRDGTSRFYAAAVAADSARGQLWDLTRTQLNGRAADQDARRLASVLARRSKTSREFFASAAGQWDRMREELFGSHFAAPALLALLPQNWVVADLGCGTGAMVALIAPHVRRVIGVDASAEMLAAARERAADFANVDLRQGALESLPLEAASVDAAVLALVLHHLPSPPAALGEAARVLKPGGQLLVLDMAPHDREEYRRRMGHVWLGFSDDQMRRWLQDAGFADVRISALPAADVARGPGLFAASASRINSINPIDPVNPFTAGVT